MKKLTVKVEAETELELAVALDEVKKKIEEGYSQGFDGGEIGNYSFEIKGGD